MKLAGTEESAGRFAFSVMNKGKLKGYAWVWLERLEPKKPRLPNPKVLAVRVANLAAKDAMIAADPVRFFTEPHYNGFPAVLVRLEAVTMADLELLLHDAWHCQAPKDRVTSKPPQRESTRSKKAR